MTTRIEMLNRALLRIGAEPLQSEDDAAAPAHLAVFDSVLDFLSGVHPWSQFRVVRRLVRRAAAPEQHYSYAHQLPTDRMGPIRAIYPSSAEARPTTDYRLIGDVIVSEHPDLWCEYLAMKAPAYWSGEFREGFTLLLMSELALSIREDHGLRDKLRRDALGTPGEQPHGGVIGQAIAADGQAEPSREIGDWSSPLIDARW